MSFFKGKTILITGGTGSFGKAFVKSMVQINKAHKIIIFSRDELKQYEMSLSYPEKEYPNIRFFLGDIRDKDRLYRALNGVDIVIHAAALKQVPAAEYNPYEFVKTNILGSQNIIEASIDCGVSNVCALSTDKAASPVNLYGATKLCSDKLFTSASSYSGSSNIKFSVVRYGNVFGSRGSVIPLFIQQVKNKEVTITHKDMTRFSITLNEGVDMVMWAAENAKGSEIFVPKIPSYRITDLARAFGNDIKVKIIGIRPGEKIHEEMISATDSYNTFDCGKYFAIVQQESNNRKFYEDSFEAIKPGDSYNSLENENFLNQFQLEKLIQEYTNSHQVASNYDS